MKVLIVKTSSLGDILHTLPALTDAKQVIPNISFDWVAEEAFAEIPTWHPNVVDVIPIALRRWRKNLFKAITNGELKSFIKKLRNTRYDLIVDFQGLIKSAIVARLARGFRVGLDKFSLTEPLARFAYQNTVSVDLRKNAIWRMRSILAQALNYPPPDSPPLSCLQRSQFNKDNWNGGKYLVFAHATTWPTKHWLDSHWLSLAKLAEKSNYQIRLPWYTELELKRAKYICEHCEAAHLIPKGNLTSIASVIVNSDAVIALDTGLAHLAAALDVPCFSLYGPTSPLRTGSVGHNQVHIVPEFDCLYCDKPICHHDGDEKISSCLETLSAEEVWNEFTKFSS